MYDKWYFEAIIDHIESVTSGSPHMRVGWANTEGYIPYPGGGEHWGCNGVGDDLFSYGFDGNCLWTGDALGSPVRAAWEYVSSEIEFVAKAAVVSMCR